MVESYSTVYIYYIFSIHSPANRHLAISLATVNNAAMNSGNFKYLYEIMISFPSDTYPGWNY